MTGAPLQIIRKGTIPVYEQVADYLRAKIAAGDYIPGEKLPGIKVLAKTLGVNHLTLRQALRTLENKGIVVTESARGTFVASASISQLQIALVLPNLIESSSRLSSGVQEEMMKSRSTVDIFHYDENVQRECESFMRLIAEGYDGAIVFPSLEPRALKPLLKMMLEGFPLVFLDRAPAQMPCWTVWVDNFRGGYLATEKLIQSGCKRIACEASELAGVSDRFEGYLRALSDHRMRVDYSLVQKFARNDDQIEGVVDGWLDSSERPDGIFFANDFQALRGLRRILARGLRVPEDIRIIGFDDYPMANLSYPGLTTIRQDFAEIGRVAAELLSEQVQLPREKRFVERRRIVPVELIQRGSC